MGNDDDFRNRLTQQLTEFRQAVEEEAETTIGQMESNLGYFMLDLCDSLGLDPYQVIGHDAAWIDMSLDVPCSEAM